MRKLSTTTITIPFPQSYIVNCHSDYQTIIRIFNNSGGAATVSAVWNGVIVVNAYALPINGNITLILSASANGNFAPPVAGAIAAVLPAFDNLEFSGSVNGIQLMALHIYDR